MKIKFGTSGWRGIIAKEFTWDKVNLVVDAIAVRLQREKRDSIVVGGDCRFLSPEFAEETAERLAGYGFSVILADRPTPTPVLSYACRKGQHGGIINFTASHNPPTYNGIKFSPWHGGPAGGERTSDIEAIVEDGLRPDAGSGSVTVQNLIPDYVDSLKHVIDVSVFQNSGLRAVYDAFSGTGSGILDTFLVDNGAAVRVINGERDPLFAGKQHPEPGADGLRDVMKEVIKSGASIGFGTDGDADRFGLVDENGDFLSPHEFFPLVLRYLAEEKKYSGLVLRSITTGSLVDRVAASLGLSVEVTPVGFKHLGGRMLEEEVVLAGEESGGMSILGHVPEKDGILACLLASEMICRTGKGLASQLHELHDEFGRLYVARRDIKLAAGVKEKIVEKCFDNTPESIGDRKIISSDNLDGAKFTFSDGSWVLIRLSGTEPIVRLYSEADTEDRMKSILDSFSGYLGV